MNYITCKQECLDFAQNLLECEQNGNDAASIYDHDLDNYITQIIARNPKIHWYEHFLNGIYYISVCGIALFLVIIFLELPFPSGKVSFTMLTVTVEANVCVIGIAGGLGGILTNLIYHHLLNKSIQPKPWKTVLLPYFFIFLCANILIRTFHLEEATFTLDIPSTASILLILFALSKSLRAYFAKKQLRQITT